jgi:uncharacterized protein YjbI with pentapeptide repeats
MIYRNLIIAALLVFSYGCSDSNNNDNVSNSLSSGIDESRISEDSSLRPALKNVVAVHLESPSQGPMPGDTDIIGKDKIPYQFTFSSPQNIEICFSSEAFISLQILNSNSEKVLDISSFSDCPTINMAAGDYTFAFENLDSGSVVISNLFIRQDPSTSNPKILINSDCQNCDLSGIIMEGLDFSGTDFSGSNFDKTYLEGNNFTNSKMDNTSFVNADITESIFDVNVFGNDLIEKKWVSADAAYRFEFTFLYSEQGQLPEIRLNINDLTNSLSHSDYAASLNSSSPLEIDLPNLQGVLTLMPVNSGAEDGAAWADLCWGSDFSSCFHGVMVTFDSFEYYSSSRSTSVLRLDNSSNGAVVLNYVNQSTSDNDVEIVVFQKNIALRFGSTAIAWKILKGLGAGDNQIFSFPLTNAIAANDSYGNFTPELQANPGQLFQVFGDASGYELAYLGFSTSIKEVQVLNNLIAGTVDVNLFKDGKLLAVNTSLMPQQKAVFEMDKTIYIGTVTEVEEGEAMSSVILRNINTQLNLLGIASADIVLTGSGTSSSPFQFNLVNIRFQ